MYPHYSIFTLLSCHISTDSFSPTFFDQNTRSLCFTSSSSSLLARVFFPFLVENFSLAHHRPTDRPGDCFSFSIFSPFPRTDSSSACCLALLASPSFTSTFARGLLAAQALIFDNNRFVEWNGERTEKPLRCVSFQILRTIYYKRPARTRRLLSIYRGVVLCSVQRSVLLVPIRRTAGIVRRTKWNARAGG